MLCRGEDGSPRIYCLFGLRGKEGEWSRVEYNWPKISLFLANSTILSSTPPPFPLNPNRPLRSSTDPMVMMLTIFFLHGLMTQTVSFVVGNELGAIPPLVMWLSSLSTMLPKYLIMFFILTGIIWTKYFITRIMIKSGAWISLYSRLSRN